MSSDAASVTAEALAEAIRLIDEAHAQDPNTTPRGGTTPHELYYARKMTDWLRVLQPDASPALQIACRAQHFRRWETPRTNFPMTRPGYLVWRARQKAGAAERVSELLTPLLPLDQVSRVAALIRKEGRNAGEKGETQTLEDAACLVFLEGELEAFAGKEDMEEDKVVAILRKTWVKMSEKGREVAMRMELGERPAALVRRALEG